jgi:ferredoxin-NADP reductase
VRLRPSPDAPALMRSYSLSGEPSAERYRVSVKREAHGAAGSLVAVRYSVPSHLAVL